MQGKYFHLSSFWRNFFFKNYINIIAVCFRAVLCHGDKVQQVSTDFNPVTDRKRINLIVSGLIYIIVLHGFTSKWSNMRDLIFGFSLTDSDIGVCVLGNYFFLKKKMLYLKTNPLFTVWLELA